MERELDRDNLRGVFRMLDEIAKGNFAYQMKRSEHTDELEALITRINMTAEELNAKRHQFLWVNRKNNIMAVKTANFLLNEKLEVIGYTNALPPRYRFTRFDNIRGKAFPLLLSVPSKVTWKEAIQDREKEDQIFFNLPLEYQLDDLLKIKLNTLITRFRFPSSLILVNSFLLDTIKDFDAEGPKNPKVEILSKWDQKLFHEIELYIQHHLDQRLIGLYEMARIFNTNEHKIKTGFKKIFGVTPKQFHRDQRIVHCKLLIKNTDLSLKQIAFKMGFSSYPHFSKSFKNTTRITPQQYRNITRQP